MRIDDALLRRVDEAVRPTLRFQNVPHPKLIVTFSGPPRAGKSTVARQLERSLKAVCLENDAVRTLATQWYPDSTFNEGTALAHEYCNYSWPKLATEIPNGLWVIDSSLDRNYSIFFEFAKNYGFDVFVIAVDIPKVLHGQWIMNGGNKSFRSMSAYLETMEQRRQEQAAFLAKHEPDVKIRPPYDVDGLVQMINIRLEQLASQQK